MGKQGPCCHCGILTTPLWRNGPPDKPVLCNACGSRWRTKGTLANYMPMHSGGFAPSDNRLPKGKSAPEKAKDQRLQKKRTSSLVDDDLMNTSRTTGDRVSGCEEAGSTRSSSVSGITYSEGCFPRKYIPEKDYSDKAAMHNFVWESPVPSKKRSFISRPRPFGEKLSKGASHDGDISFVSSSSEDDLGYGVNSNFGSTEIGLGTTVLSHPRSKTVDDDSEASSLMADSRGCNIVDASYVNIRDDDEMGNRRKTSDLGILHNSDARRSNLTMERFLLSSTSLALCSEIKDSLNYETFSTLLTEEEQSQLMRLVSSDDRSNVPESLKLMFRSEQFEGALVNFQRLISKGMFCGTEFGGNNQLLKVFRQLLFTTELTKSGWMSGYSLLYKQFEHKQFESSKVNAKQKKVMNIPNRNGDGNLKSSSLGGEDNFLRGEIARSDRYELLINSSGQPPGHSICGTKSQSKIATSSGVRESTQLCASTPWKNYQREETHQGSINTGNSISKESPLSDCEHWLSPEFDAVDEASDSVLLFDVPSNNSFPQAELLPKLEWNTSPTR
ncbi:hypothetical protein AMTRI_Chr01g135690 [Amborella trichopoda]